MGSIPDEFIFYILLDTAAGFELKFCQRKRNSLKPTYGYS